MVPVPQQRTRTRVPGADCGQVVDKRINFARLGQLFTLRVISVGSLISVHFQSLLRYSLSHLIERLKYCAGTRPALEGRMKHGSDDLCNLGEESLVSSELHDFV